MPAEDTHLSDLMQRYRNLSGNSGVVAYGLHGHAIVVQFEDGGVYLYTYASTGRDKVERMKQLAAEGRGLSAFIAQHVREHYASKLR
jgi:hypothetical protein